MRSTHASCPSTCGKRYASRETTAGPARCDAPNTNEAKMNVTLSAGPLVSLIAGILILIVPRLLNYIVAIYLIVIGLLGLLGAGVTHTV
jgi:hypothetical protein